MAPRPASPPHWIALQRLQAGRTRPAPRSACLPCIRGGLDLRLGQFQRDAVAACWRRCQSAIAFQSTDDLAAADAEEAAEIDHGGARRRDPLRSTMTSTMRPMSSSAALRTSRPRIAVGLASAPMMGRDRRRMRALLSACPATASLRVRPVPLWLLCESVASDGGVCGGQEQQGAGRLVCGNPTTMRRPPPHRSRDDRRLFRGRNASRSHLHEPLRRRATRVAAARSRPASWPRVRKTPAPPRRPWRLTRRFDARVRPVADRAGSPRSMNAGRCGLRRADFVLAPRSNSSPKTRLHQRERRGAGPGLRRAGDRIERRAAAGFWRWKPQNSSGQPAAGPYRWRRRTGP